MHFEIATYRVLHERCNNTAPLAEQLNFKKMTFYRGVLGETRQNKTQKVE